MIRAVLDANVVASALIQPKGNSGKILHKILTGDAIQLVISVPILQEIGRILHYPRIRKRVEADEADIVRFLTSLQIVSDVVEVKKGLSAVVDADPDDDKYVWTALEGHCQYIVSGDHHLTDLGQYQGISIVTPGEFAKRVLK